MSALQAVQADGFYNPPDWDPTKIGRDQYQRSKGKNQYETKGVIRFELMYNCWCDGCKRAIGRGTRFNARKIRPTSGPQTYFSTKIWEFRMKCATCPQEFVIRTDPKNRDYEFVSGIRRINSMPTAKQAENFELTTEDKAARLESDAFYKLEHEEEDKRKAEAQLSVVAKLHKISDANHRDDYKLNRLLRARVRGGRKQRKELAEEGRKVGFNFALLAESADDKTEAKNVRFHSTTASRASAIAQDRSKLLETKPSTALVVKGKVTTGTTHRKRKPSGMASKAVAGRRSRSSIVSAVRDEAAEALKRRRFEIRAGSIFGNASKSQSTAAKLAALHAKRRRLGIKSSKLRLASRGRK